LTKVERDYYLGLPNLRFFNGKWWFWNVGFAIHMAKLIHRSWSRGELSCVCLRHLGRKRAADVRCDEKNEDDEQ
jgi:hypothetical protein